MKRLKKEFLIMLLLISAFVNINYCRVCEIRNLDLSYEVYKIEDDIPYGEGKI